MILACFSLILGDFIRKKSQTRLGGAINFEISFRGAINFEISFGGLLKKILGEVINFQIMFRGVVYQ